MRTMSDLPQIYLTPEDMDRLLRLVESRPGKEAERLERELVRANVVPREQMPQDVVTMNSRVLFENETTHERREVTLVYPGSADIDAGKISVLVPVGTALLGLQVGQSMIYAPDYPRRSVGRPITLDDVACDFPELILIGIHVGIPWTDEMIAMAWKHKKVYIGSDAHAPKYWPPSFVHYIKSFGQDKVLFGTDFPVLGFERTREEVEALNIPDGAKRKFLRDNAIRIYKLPIK